jgi:hypothetical protein
VDRSVVTFASYSWLSGCRFILLAGSLVGILYPLVLLLDVLVRVHLLFFKLLVLFEG